MNRFTYNSIRCLIPILSLTFQGFFKKDRQNAYHRLKSRCGSGGSVKKGIIIIPGDHRKTVQAELTEAGFTVKLAGG